VDWEVVEIEGKGMGIVAKKFIPSKYRIIVDAHRQFDNPQIMRLSPKNGNLIEKIKLNGLAAKNGEAVVCLRIARSNHNCNPNADHRSLDDIGVKVLFAERDIQKGEEICISYTHHNDITKKYSVEECSLKLLNCWNIKCPSDCCCNNDHLKSLLKEARKIYHDDFPKLMHLNSKDAVVLMRRLCLLQPEMGNSWYSIMDSCFEGFQACIMQQRTMKEALEYRALYFEIRKSIFDKYLVESCDDMFINYKFCESYLINDK
jgi:hypothetical protein